MFGLYNETRNRTEDNLNNSTANEYETSFGGFGSRWSYERCVLERRNRIAARVSKISLGVLMFLFVGMLGTLSGVMMFELVQNNKTLYYPDGTLNDRFISSDADVSAGNSDSSHSSLGAASLSEASYSKDGFEISVVTEELSKKFRIPTGVLINLLDSASNAYLAGIRPGDIIVGIDGNEIKGVDDVLKLSGTADQSGSIRVTVFRNNRYTVFEYVN